MGCLLTTWFKFFGLSQAWANASNGNGFRKVFYTTYTIGILMGKNPVAISHLLFDFFNALAILQWASVFCSWHISPGVSQPCLITGIAKHDDWTSRNADLIRPTCLDSCRQMAGVIPAISTNLPIPYPFFLLTPRYTKNKGLRCWWLPIGSVCMVDWC